MSAIPLIHMEHVARVANHQDLLFSRAVERLKEGRHAVREVAEELGYSNAEHFSRFFRSRAGVPPSAYREEIERANALARQCPS